MQQEVSGFNSTPVAPIINLMVTKSEPEPARAPMPEAVDGSRYEIN